LIINEIVQSVGRLTRSLTVIQTVNMTQKINSLRPFIGAKNFDLSRRFYTEFGFQESVLSHDMSYFSRQDIGFYLQDAYVKDWVDNTMVFLEVEDVEQYWHELLSLDLPGKFDGVRLTPIRHESWGKECFLHDPSGILWHFGEFLK
jgi:catechol 2,3-dioxygenase-like lactoylglutathione lyase family enzyme